MYQSEAVVHSQHDNVDGSGVVGHTHAATLRSVLPVVLENTYIIKTGKINIIDHCHNNYNSAGKKKKSSSA